MAEGFLHCLGEVLATRRVWGARSGLRRPPHCPEQLCAVIMTHFQVASQKQKWVTGLDPVLELGQHQFDQYKGHCKVYLGVGADSADVRHPPGLRVVQRRFTVALALAKLCEPNCTGPDSRLRIVPTIVAGSCFEQWGGPQRGPLDPYTFQKVGVSHQVA